MGWQEKPLKKLDLYTIQSKCMIDGSDWLTLETMRSKSMT